MSVYLLNNFLLGKEFGGYRAIFYLFLWFVISHNSLIYQCLLIIEVSQSPTGRQVRDLQTFSRKKRCQNNLLWEVSALQCHTVPYRKVYFTLSIACNRIQSQLPISSSNCLPMPANANQLTVNHCHKLSVNCLPIASNRHQ